MDERAGNARCLHLLSFGRQDGALSEVAFRACYFVSPSGIFLFLK